MRLVLQRVTEASVTVDGQIVGQIGRGLVALCGIHETDGPSASEWAVKKICNTRLWEKDGKAWASSASSPSDPCDQILRQEQGAGEQRRLSEQHRAIIIIIIGIAI